MRVLLVEDDAMIAQGLQAALRQAGYAVDWMRDGKSATLALQPAVFDLILLDLGLPGIDGWEMARLLTAAAEALAAKTEKQPLIVAVTVLIPASVPVNVVVYVASFFPSTPYK